MDSLAGMLCELPCLSELSAGHPRSFAFTIFLSIILLLLALVQQWIQFIETVFCITDKYGNLYQYHDTGEGDGADR